MRRSALLGAIFSIFIPAYAGAPVDTYQMLATHAHVRDTWEMGLASCIRQGKVQSPAAFYRDDPTFYAGLNPNSPYWPELVQAYQDFAKVFCSYLGSTQVERYFVDQYRGHLSESEAKEALAFLDSPVGQKVVNIQIAAHQWTLDFMEKRHAAKVRAASIAYSKRLQGIYSRALRPSQPGCPPSNPSIQSSDRVRPNPRLERTGARPARLDRAAVGAGRSTARR